MTLSQEKTRQENKPGPEQTRPGLTADSQPVVLTPEVMRQWPLPQPADDCDKEERGRVLVVGGALEMPGTVILAGTAALRAGAGKLRIMVGRSIASLVAAAIPEARVFAMPETRDGAIAASAASQIAEQANGAQAVLIGPGLVDEKAVAELMRSLLPHLENVPLILDAAALVCLSEDPACLHHSRGPVMITPHAGEMAHLLDTDKSEIQKDPLGTARRAAAQLRAVVALKGAETFIAGPDGRVYHNQGGCPGLGTAGSGDTLSGIIAGLAARGAEPIQAASWGVYLHARAGERLAEKIGPLGFLAREILLEVPGLMAELG